MKKTKRRLITAMLWVLLVSGMIGSVARAAGTEPDLTVTVNAAGSCQFRIAQVKNGETGSLAGEEAIRLMHFEIKTDEETLFEGPGSALLKTVFDWINLRPDEVLNLYVTAEFDVNAGNEYQGVPFAWTFGFESQDLYKTQIGLSSREFYYNPNVDPGDILTFSIRVINNPTGETRPTEPTNPTEPGEQGTTTKPADPPDTGKETDPGVKTGGIAEAAQKYLPMGILCVSMAVLLCIGGMLLVPAKKKSNS